MPAAYVLVEVEVFDPANFEAYRSKAPDTIQKHGGEYIVRGGPFKKLEGEDPLPRLVVIRFPSRDSAMQWYDSDEYRALIPIRQNCAHTKMIIVDGLE